MKMTALLSLAFLLPAGLGLAESPISNARQLTFEGKRSGEGYFSADGSRMIFQSEREEGNPFYQIYTLDMETGDVERVSPGIGKTTCAWLHPTENKALFASTQYDPEAEAKMQAELDFRASGQSRRYAWDYDPTYEIVAQDLDARTYTRLTDAEGYDAEGSYSPDGSKIAFASNRHAYAGDLSAEEQAILDRDPSYFMEIYVMNADGTDVERLTTTPGYDGGPFWSADGSKITWRRFSEDGARAEIFTMNADGSGEKQLTDMGVLSWAPYFHPSGKYLIFATNLQGFANFELYLVDAEGAHEPVRVSDREGFDGLPVFAPSGDRLSWTSTATSQKQSQIFIADWDHEAALALLAEAPLRGVESASPIEGTAAAISVGDLRRHVEALASDEMEGRLTGTEGELKATAYVASAFEGLGLTGAGDEGGLFQIFEFTAGVDLNEGNKMQVSLDGEPQDLELGETWRPLGFSQTGDIEAREIVFAGYGLKAPGDGEHAEMDSYDGLDVDGKWVLIWRGMPEDVSADARTYLARFADLRYKVSVAKAAGAAGVIFSPPPSPGFNNGFPPLSYGASSDRGAMPVVAITRRPMQRMLSVLGDAQDALAAEVEAGKPAGALLEGVTVSGAVQLKLEKKQGRNVLGRLELGGEGPPLVIGAHVDHLGHGEPEGSLARGDDADKIHYGADDNASGVAAVIEVAQYLADLKAEGKLDGARDVIFAAWSGEELGLLGANHFTGAMAKEAGVEDLSDQVSAYLNMDMVGRMRDKVVISGLGSSPVWAGEVERRNAVIGLPIVTSQDTYLPTDSTEFYLAGVPILSAFTGAHEDYHRPSDTAEKLNYEGLKDIARFMGLVARSRTLDAEEPEYVALARPQGQGNRRVGGVFLGTIPDYATEGVSGVPISGVVKDGPAEEAGLKGGDVIVGLAGEDLADIYDYVRVLNGLKPGEAVGIAVSRDGETVEMEIVPGTRD